MAFALRPRDSASAISSRNGSQALALGARPGLGGQGEGSGSVDACSEMAGFAPLESVDTPAVVAGFDAGSVDTPVVVAGFGGQVPGRPPLTRTAMPAAFRYALAVSRRTPVDSSMRRSDQPSRPNATTDCFFSSSKTLLIPAVDHVTHRLVNVSAPTRGGRFSGVPQWPVLGVPRGNSRKPRRRNASSRNSTSRKAEPSLRRSTTLHRQCAR